MMKFVFIAYCLLISTIQLSHCRRSDREQSRGSRPADEGDGSSSYEDFYVAHRPYKTESPETSYSASEDDVSSPALGPDDYDRRRDGSDEESDQNSPMPDQFNAKAGQNINQQMVPVKFGSKTRLQQTTTMPPTQRPNRQPQLANLFNYQLTLLRPKKTRQTPMKQLIKIPDKRPATTANQPPVQAHKITIENGYVWELPTRQFQPKSEQPAMPEQTKKGQRKGSKTRTKISFKTPDRLLPPKSAIRFADTTGLLRNAEAPRLNLREPIEWDTARLLNKTRRPKMKPSTTTTTTTTTTTSTTTTTTTTTPRRFITPKRIRPSPIEQTLPPAQRKPRLLANSNVKKIDVDVDKLYGLWKQTYGRLHAPIAGQAGFSPLSGGLLKDSRRNLEAVKKRKRVFVRNIKRISKHNRLYEQGKVSYKMSMNQFTDMTIEELRTTMGISLSGLVDNPEAMSKRPGREGGFKLMAPKEVDWTKRGAAGTNYITRVKSQKSCASCYAFAAAATIEAHYAILAGEVVEFSEQELLDCTFSYGNKGCHNGRVHTIYQYAADAGQLCTESSYPYRIAANKSSCAAKRCDDRRELHLEYPYYFKLPPRDTKSIMEAIAVEGPVACEFAVMDSFAYYGGGVYTGDKNCTEATKRDHVMLVVGYGTDKETGLPYWKVKNSWSEKWGEQGYLKIQRGKNICGIEKACRFPRFNLSYYNHKPNSD